MTANALITGASKGIGLKLARLHASMGGNVILVARDETLLKEAKMQWEREYNVDVHLIPKDLSLPDSAKEVFDEVKALKLEVDYLINNAGMGDYGYFAETDWTRYANMINLNIMALTRLCHLFIEDWKGRRQGKILNVASVAAFMPGPKMAVYFATKTYVLSFSEAVGKETEKYGISVTALCPGPTATFFMDDSRMKNSRMLKDKKLPTPKEVARVGYRAMLQGKSVAIPGVANKLLASAGRFLPKQLVLNTVNKIL